MPDARPASRAPWIIAAVAGVAFVIALVVFFVPLAHARRGPAPGQLSANEQTAMSAAATETSNFTTLSRAHFAQDFSRALAGSTGALKSDLQARKATSLKLLQQGKFDLTSRIVHEALEGPTGNGNGYVVMIIFEGYKSTAPDNPVPSNLEVTVVRSGGRYLASNVTNIAVS